MADQGRQPSDDGQPPGTATTVTAPPRGCRFRVFDEAYVRRLRNRDPEAERQFVAYFGELIAMKLRRRLRSRPLIEDVCQETLSRVLRAVGRPEGLPNSERLGPFVNSVCNDVMREGWRRPATVATERGADPDRAASLIGEERKELVRRAIQRLSDRDQRVLRALLLEKRDKGALCAQLGVDRDYLPLLLRRARLHYRALDIEGRQSKPLGAHVTQHS